MFILQLLYNTLAIVYIIITESGKMYINDFKIVRILKFILSKIWLPFFKIQYNICNRFKNNKKKIRLFTTTGNISLINNLAIINEIGNFDKYEDILFVDPGKGRKAFIEKTLQIASLHKFKKIYFAIGTRLSSELILKNIVNIDELYLLNHPKFIEPFTEVYDKTPVILTDEGAASLMNYNSDKIKNLKCFKTHKYLDKIDFLGLEDINKIKFEKIDIKEFQKIARILSERYPISYKLNPEDKAILYCGIYWEVTGLSREKFVEVQSNMLNDLLNAGYKILYKPHPRDNEYFGFDKNPNVIFIDSKFPIEIYNLDVVAIVSVSSTTSINPAHYGDIPCFSNVVKEALSHDNNDIVSIDIIRRMVKEYSPDYTDLLKFDVKSLSKEELKQQLKQLYKAFILSKPLLSENKNIKEFL